MATKGANVNNGVISVSVKEIAKVVMMGFKLKHAVFIHGAPGIGKSDIIRQIGAIQNRPVYDIRLALMNPVDLRGIPMVVNGETVWMAPEFFKHAENAILFFDEFPAAPPAVQAAAYQIVLDRQIGEFKLPASCDIVAAGNRQEDKGLNYKIAPALLNRFVHLNVEHDFEAWKDWALNNNVHSDVIGFLNFRTELLFRFSQGTNTGNFPTPRSWARMSEAIKLIETDGSFTGMDNLTIFAGYVGVGTATEFQSFRKYAKTIPNARDIIEKGNMKIKLESTEPSVIHAFCAALVNVALTNTARKDSAGKDQPEGMEAAGNLMQYLQTKPFGNEYVTLVARDFFRSTRGQKMIPQFVSPNSKWKEVSKIIHQIMYS
jgi:hypothetical protein